MQRLKFSSLVSAIALAFLILISLSLRCLSLSFAQAQSQDEEKMPAGEEPQEVALIPKPDIEFNLDINSKTIPKPKVLSAGIDLSGRGFHRHPAWPYHLADKQVLQTWHKELGFGRGGVFRLRWNFWETYADKKKPDEFTQDELIGNYENIIKTISDSGGIVILSLYGAPPGLGRALDKRSPPANLKQWRALVKDVVRYLSCEKKYNVWYEVWDTPDSEQFFLGLNKDYFNLYRTSALAIKELQSQYKINIPVGAPATTWWFQNLDGNAILTPEKSLIYELIKYCSQYKLPLDFISWHAYSTDPYAEKEITTYNKFPSQLIRDWLTFFRFDRNTPLIINEWNYDSYGNIQEERGDKSHILASFIPARLRSMYEAEIDYQSFFSLEDFQNDKGKINNNRGLFFYDPASDEYKGGAKSAYNVFLMLNLLGDSFYKQANINDEFVGVLATKNQQDIAILIWNYIDPQAGVNLISRNVAALTEKGRTHLLNLVKENKLEKVINREISWQEHNPPERLKNLLKKASELNLRSSESINKQVNLKISLSNLKGDYLYQRYTVDSSCVFDCAFLPVEEKQLTNTGGRYEQTLQLDPYCAHLIILKNKGKER